MEEDMNRCLAITCLLVLCASATGAAHHGAAAYDLSTTTTLDARVIAFRWVNPHALLTFDAVDEAGAVRRWTAETAGLTILLRAGWSAATLQPGMAVKVTGHAARNGTAAMLLEHVVLPEGRTLTNFVPR
jgi:hypothetical protein